MFEGFDVVYDKDVTKVESVWIVMLSQATIVSDNKNDKIYVAGCYNGSGIGVGTLFGEQIAIKASDENSPEIEIINNRKKPTWLPPQPFLNIGVKARLIYERIRAKTEI